MDLVEAIIGLIGAVIGFLLSYFIERRNRRKNKHEKAIEIAKEFENVLSSGDFRVEVIYSDILNELKLMGELKFLENIDNKSTIYFDKKELIENIGEEGIKKYEDFINPQNAKFIKMIAQSKYNEKNNEMFFNKLIRDFDDKMTVRQNIDELSRKFKKANESRDDEKPEEIENLNNQMLSELKSYCWDLFQEFMEQAQNVLNKFEWMSMYFVTGIADSDYVYKSLHQFYFSFVKSMYVQISNINDRESYDNYYTNITALFIDWKKKYSKEKEKFNKAYTKLNKTSKKV